MRLFPSLFVLFSVLYVCNSHVTTILYFNISHLTTICFGLELKQWTNDIKYVCTHSEIFGMDSLVLGYMSWYTATGHPQDQWPRHQK